MRPIPSMICPGSIAVAATLPKLLSRHRLSACVHQIRRPSRPLAASWAAEVHRLPVGRLRGPVQSSAAGASSKMHLHFRSRQLVHHCLVAAARILNRADSDSRCRSDPHGQTGADRTLGRMTQVQLPRHGRGLPTAAATAMVPAPYACVDILPDTAMSSRTRNLPVTLTTDQHSEDCGMHRAAVLDTSGRRIVPQPMAPQMPARRIGKAPAMAVPCHQPKESVIHHSEQAWRYMSLSFGRRPETRVVQSMGSVGHMELPRHDGHRPNLTQPPTLLPIAPRSKQNVPVGLDLFSESTGLQQQVRYTVSPLLTPVVMEALVNL